MSEQNPQTFRQWLKQQEKRDDPVGDLARDVKADRPGVSSVEGLRRVLEEHGAFQGAMDALETAAGEYGQS